MKDTPIELIVGLGNPGPQYTNNRHNAGAWMIQMLADNAGENLTVESKFHGEFAKIHLHHKDCRLLIPTTFMNNSGRAVQAAANFYKIKPENILIIHDELDLPVQTIKLKNGGGHGGHNGLRDIIKSLGTNNFHRLRIGIGHPGQSHQVHNYVLHDPSKDDRHRIDSAMENCLSIMPDLLDGNIQTAMKALHTQKIDNR